MGGRWDDLFHVVKKMFSHILKNAEHKQDLCHSGRNKQYTKNTLDEITRGFIKKTLARKRHDRTIENVYST